MLKRKKLREKFIGRTRLERFLGFLFVKSIFRLTRYRNSIEIARDILKLIFFLLDAGVDQRKLYYNREKLLRYILKNELSISTVVYEFGVAKGYLSSFMLSQPGNEKISKWHGFDTFDGLPKPWRDYSKESFTNNGQIPNRNDSRITWHKGYVESTVNEFSIHRDRESAMFIFDLDLESPTRHVFDIVQKRLKVGDVLFFDEAFDDGEFRLITELLSTTQDLKFEVIGFTPIAVALKLE